jgi:glycosyltransferase involved in cell wall biosynthesis
VSDPAVTVCVTCYNQEAYIGQCLDGILAQDFDGPMEILIGDDGSTDASIPIIEGYARRDPRIRLIRRPENLGFIKNEGDLFRRARGEFIAICEGDDVWIDPQKLSRQLAIMRERPDVSLCVTAGFKVRNDGKTLAGRLQISPESRELTMAELIAEMHGRVPTPSLVMRRTALEALPPEIYDLVLIDYSWQVLLGLQGKVWYDAKPAVFYRVGNPGSWTEGLSSGPKFLAHHESVRTYQRFLEGQVGKRWVPNLQRAFEPVIVGFYMSSRIAPADKKRNLPHDLPRLSRRGKIVATMLTHMPLLVTTGAFARRRIWTPIRAALSGR